MSIEQNIKDGKYKNTLDYSKHTRLAYQNENYRLDALFRTDVESEFGTDRLPKVVSDRIFNLAWDQGHSSGYEDVFMYYSDMVDLFNAVASDWVKVMIG